MTLITFNYLVQLQKRNFETSIGEEKLDGSREGLRTEVKALEVKEIVESRGHVEERKYTG